MKIQGITYKVFKTLLFFILPGIGSFSLSAQMEFQAKVSKETLGINERLRVDFVMNKDGDNFNPPDFEGFIVVGGPSQQVSQSWVNGKKSFSKIYSYFLEPARKGKVTIGQASIEYDGQTYKTIPIEIKVTNAVEIPKDPNDPSYLASQNIHILAELSDPTPYLNEPVFLQYKLLVSSETDVSGPRLRDVPQLTGFWNQKIERDSPIQRMEYKGKSYRYVVVYEALLYPQKTGTLEIDPLSMEMSVGVRTNQRDFFGNYVYKNIEKVFYSPKLEVQVKPLPENGKPLDFSGAVGDFKLSAELSKKKLQATESTQLTLKLSGSGNLKLATLPEMDFPEGLDVYDPERKENIRVAPAGMNGSVSWTYTIVPNRGGKYPLNGLSFSYFDPNQERYKTISTENLLLDAGDAPAGAITSVNTPNSPTQQPVSLLGGEMRYIKLNTQLVSSKAKSFFLTPTYLGLLAGPVLMIPIVLFLSRKQRERLADEQGNKTRKANKLAKKYLSEAGKSVGNQEVFYEALERALHNYLKAKLKIETTEFAKEKIQQLLLERNAGETSTAAFITLLQACELARYAPSTQVAMEQDLKKADTVINQLDKNLN